ncbi:MAG: hypothetical protein HUU55_08015 [Myxococcales bacterium]|nr:hypothetical protein [Myxococcales bacterium]
MNRHSQGSGPTIVIAAIIAIFTGIACDSADDGGDDNTSGPESSFYSNQEQQQDQENNDFGSGSVKIQVSVNPTKPDGDDWDVFGGAPDPFIVVGGYSFEFEACQDTFFCSFEVSGSGPFAIEVYDSDLSTNDYAGSVTCDRGDTCTTNNGGATVTVK